MNTKLECPIWCQERITDAYGQALDRRFGRTYVDLSLAQAAALSMETKAKQAERAEYADKIREHVKPGDTIYTVLRHRARSGMTRDISLIVDGKDGPWDFSGLAAKALGLRWNRHNGGIRVGGCGMDMGSHLVYELSAKLWPNGHECTGEKCTSNDHSNGDRDRTRHMHRDAGYALRQRWL